MDEPDFAWQKQVAKDKAGGTAVTTDTDEPDFAWQKQAAKEAKASKEKAADTTETDFAWQKQAAKEKAAGTAVTDDGVSSLVKNFSQDELEAYGQYQPTKPDPDRAVNNTRINAFGQGVVKGVFDPINGMVRGAGMLAKGVGLDTMGDSMLNAANEYDEKSQGYDFSNSDYKNTNIVGKMVGSVAPAALVPMVGMGGGLGAAVAGNAAIGAAYGGATSQSDTGTERLKDAPYRWCVRCCCTCCRYGG